jgi:type I restriction enzyme, S subunit
MTEWQEVTIEKIASSDRYSVVGGPFGSALGRKDYVDHGVPVIRGAQLGGPGTFTHDDLVFVSEEKADRHRGNLAYPEDVLVTQRGTVGQIGLVPNSAPYDRYLLSQSQMKLTVDPTRADVKFVYYWLLSPEAQHQMRGATISAGVPHINLETFKSLVIRLPPIPIQRSISSLLGTIDDLIENNRRRVEVLEEMVRAIYKEWFVYFRYPGLKTAKFVESQLGAVPEGWGVTTVARLASSERNAVTGVRLARSLVVRTMLTKASP